jgi:dolichol-phosphate mannosyltransferase
VLVIALSLVIPAYNEAGNIAVLAREIDQAMARLGEPWEAIWVDDGSTDATIEALRALGPPHRYLRFGANRGQSAALCAGIRAARGEWVGTLDADGQNDPADIVRQLAHARAHGADMVNGVRVSRRDSWVRRWSSKIANAYRRALLHDSVTDVGCSTRVMRRELLTDLPFFHGMHRYLPTLVAMRGGTIDELPVAHRPRTAGVSKYGIGNRLWAGLEDVRGMRWLRSRQRPWTIVETGPEPAAHQAARREGA